MALIFALLLASLSGPGFAKVPPRTRSPVTSGNQAIEIDDLDNNPNTTPNANMVQGADAANPDLPFVAGATYIDWNDLALPAGGPPAGKYALIDGTGPADDGFAGTGTSSCLQPDHAAPQKEDVYRAYLANNSQYLYFGLIDKSANGDSRHIILFHKNPLTVGASCAGDGSLISLDLTPSDRIVRATFKPSATEPAAQVYTVVGDPAPMLIDAAANFANTSVWTPGALAINFAVNTTAIPADRLGFGEPNSSPVIAETFGEGAASLAALGVPSCGGQYQVSVITRSSGSGGGEAKDFIGGVYDFGSLAVTGSLTPSCDLAFGYSAQATDQNGANLPDDDVTYEWSCNDGALTFTGKSGTEAPVAAGTYNCTVTATQTSSSCTAAAADLTTTVTRRLQSPFRPTRPDRPAPSRARPDSITATSAPSASLPTRAAVTARTPTAGRAPVRTRPRPATARLPPAQWIFPTATTAR